MEETTVVRITLTVPRARELLAALENDERIHPLDLPFYLTAIRSGLSRAGHSGFADRAGDRIEARKK